MSRNACRDRFITSLPTFEMLEGRDKSVPTGNSYILKKPPVESKGMPLPYTKMLMMYRCMGGASPCGCPCLSDNAHFQQN